jgi:hypothetical protein
VADGSAQGDSSAATSEVEIVRLDGVPIECGDADGRVVLKVDVEGFEVEVLDGARSLLADPRLLAVVIEINGSGTSYGWTDQDILDRLTAAGLEEVSYDPLRRTLRSERTAEQTRIFVRDIDDLVKGRDLGFGHDAIGFCHLGGERDETGREDEIARSGTEHGAFAINQHMTCKRTPESAKRACKRTERSSEREA